MAANGLTVQLYFLRILEAAFPNIGEFNDFVKQEAVTRPDLSELGLTFDEYGDVVDAHRLGDIRIKIAQQLFQSSEDLKTWVNALKLRYNRKGVVQEATKRLEQEQAKPPLWAITDENDSDQFVFENGFLGKTLSYELKSRFRLDSFEPLLSSRNSAQDLDQDKLDFNQAKCIVISRSAGNDSPAQDLISNVVDLALSAHEAGEVAPRIVFTAGTREQALALQTFVTDKWTAITSGPPPFLFLIPSDDQREIADQRAKAKAFLTPAENVVPALPGKGARTILPEVNPPPPPPPIEQPTENDLVVLVGGKLTEERDVARFNQLTKLLGEGARLLIVQPWSDRTDVIEWNRELELKLGAAERPLLVECVGESHNSIREVAVFYEYLLLSAASRPGAVDVMARLPAILASASRQRLIWNPSGVQIRAPAGAEIALNGPAELAPLIQRRLGLAEDAAPFPAYVAVEEVIVDQKADSRLRRALKKHLSIVAGGTGEPPSTDSVVPFLFQRTPDKDPLHLAVENFLPSGPNIVAACDVSRGARTLKQYLTDINARIRVGVNNYVKEKSAQAPDCILRIVVMVAESESKRLDSEFKDSANGSWRVIKFKRKAEEYEPDLNDIELTKAWVNEQLDDAKNRGPHNSQGSI